LSGGEAGATTLARGRGGTGRRKGLKIGSVLMKRFLRRLWIQIFRDDLFIRIASLFGGVVIGGFGIFIAVHLLRDEPIETFSILFLILPAFFVLWSVLLVSRCFTSSASRIARAAEQSFPDGGVQAEGLIVVFLAILLPAAFLTVGLRWLGVKGERFSSELLRDRTVDR
jgi:hypothetical protein